jgi:hypothetical protein
MIASIDHRLIDLCLALVGVCEREWKKVECK